MARFGKLPVKLPEGVKLEHDREKLVVVGPKGSVEKKMPRGIKIEESEGQACVVKTGSSKKAGALQGTMKSHLANMVKGVTEGWSKVLEIVGAGYRAEVSGDELVMSIGYSHQVKLKIPEGIDVKVEKSLVTIEGVDKDMVGQFAAKIRSKRTPDPYKGAGIRYQGEEIRRKVGKQAAKIGE